MSLFLASVMICKIAIFLKVKYYHQFIATSSQLTTFASVSKKATDCRSFLERSAIKLTIQPLSAVVADHLGHSLAMMGNIAAGILTARSPDDSVVA